MTLSVSWISSLHNVLLQHQLECDQISTC